MVIYIIGETSAEVQLILIIPHSKYIAIYSTIYKYFSSHIWMKRVDKDYYRVLSAITNKVSQSELAVLLRLSFFLLN